MFHSECPWPAAQAEISSISSYKTAHDKVQCVYRTLNTILNLLSLTSAVPAADDLIPVLVYVLIKVRSSICSRVRQTKLNTYCLLSPTSPTLNLEYPVLCHVNCFLVRKCRITCAGAPFSHSFGFSCFSVYRPILLLSCLRCNMWIVSTLTRWKVKSNTGGSNSARR